MVDRSGGELLTAEHLNDIASELQLGMIVYINPDTLEYKAIPDLDDPMLDNEDLWQEELEIVENEWDSFITIEKMSSRDAFRIMEDFIEEIGDRVYQKELSDILGRKSPFANFKAEIESSSYRQEWFNFRDRRNLDYVKTFLQLEDIPFEEEDSDYTEED